MRSADSFVLDVVTDGAQQTTAIAKSTEEAKEQSSYRCLAIRTRDSDDRELSGGMTMQGRAQEAQHFRRGRDDDVGHTFL